MSDKTAQDFTLYASYERAQLLLLGGLGFSAGTQVQDILHEAGNAFVWYLRSCPEEVFGLLSTVLIRDCILPAGDRGVPRRK